MPTAAESTRGRGDDRRARRPGRAGGCASPSSRRSCWPACFAVLYAITAWQDDSLLTRAGVRSILLLACPLAIFAASQTLCMLTGGIDLSIAMTANLAAYVAATESDRGTVAGAGPGARRRARRRRSSTAWPSACSRSTR